MCFSAGASFAGGVVITAIGVMTVRKNRDPSRRMWLLGALMAFSCLVTGIFFKEYLTSVWCFFAAFISMVIWLIVRNEKSLVIAP